MIGKEWRDVRWKLAIGIAIVFAMGVFIPVDTLFPNPYSLFGESANVIAPSPREDAGYLQYLLWTQWFSEASGNLVLMLLAAFFGAGLISGETNRGTIFLLLSRPIDRKNVLLAKYGLGAMVLFVIVFFGSITLLVTVAALGYPQDTQGVLVSAALMWLGLLFIFGTALALSVSMNSFPIAVIGTMFVWVLTSVFPAFVAQQAAIRFTGAQDRFPATLFDALSLSPYWTSLEAYSGNVFPTTQFFISIVAAAIPLLTALWLFNRKKF